MFSSSTILHLRLIALLATSSLTNARRAPSLRTPSHRVLAKNVEFERTLGYQDSDRELIVGGQEASVGDFPYYVTSVGGGYCGGSLVAPSVVLTAAHCGNLFTNGRSVLVGATRRGSTVGGAVLRSVTQGIIHPQYDNNTLFYDLMLLQLSSPVTTIEPVAWNTNTSVPVQNPTNVSVMGFGRTAFRVGDPSQNLLRIELQTVSDDLCFRRYGASNVDMDVNICARYPPEGDPMSACQGDSGGPMIMQATDPDGLTYPLLVGVVSWGVECGHDFYPGVYAKPNADVAWMENTICQLSPDCSQSTLPPTPAPTEANPVNDVKVTFTYDNSPAETQWDIISVGEDGQETVIYTGPSYNASANQTWSSTFNEFPSGEFKFVIRDENGLQPGAGFEIHLENAAHPDGLLLASGPASSFVGSSSTPFSVASPTAFSTQPPSLAPSASPQASPTTSASATDPPTRAPSAESHACVCLSGPLGCLAHLCHAQDNDKSECENLGCTWMDDTNTGSTPPPNVEDPKDDDDDDGSIEIMDEEDSNLKKAGISAMVGAVAAVVTFCVLSICAAVWCNCGKRRSGESPLPSSRQPSYPSKKDNDIRRASTASDDDSEVGHGY